MTVVLDASALLALLRGEPGGDLVKPMLDGALVTSVNWTEVADHYTMQSAFAGRLGVFLDKIPVQVVVADAALALAAASLKPLTRAAGLSLGDRYCVARGARENLTVVTADRIWERIAEAVGVTFMFIR